jgi:hypothetical protein
MPTSKANRLAFAGITVVCAAAALLYTYYSARNTRARVEVFTPPIATSQPQSSPAPVPPAVASSDTRVEVRQTPDSRPSHPRTTMPSEPERASTPRPRLIALNMRDSSERGHVEVSEVPVSEHRTATELRCERVYFASGKGICLTREFQFFTVRTVATMVDADFKPVSSTRADGIPSRARVSPDGHVAAFTVFVTGHSYGDAQLSTATVLLNADSGATIANLEEFSVIRDGDVIASPDFNFWGVTFQQNSNLFYSTLRTGGVNYLVHGDIRARTATIVHSSVECPSLSPDGKRIAFKKLIARNNWRLSVLDLATKQETPLAETRSVDDQPEWLDDDHVLYGIIDEAPWMSIMVVPADGRGQPELFAKGAASPAIVR